MIEIPIAEKFYSLQGEGVYAGTPMAFIRFSGCSIGKTICHHCDTDFDRVYPWRGGGYFTAAQLRSWVIGTGAYHVCFTGGEPLDQDELPNIIKELAYMPAARISIETSGTKLPEWLPTTIRQFGEIIHLTVSPKPGWRRDVIELAQEIKVIAEGLGNGEGWPSLQTAIEWAREGRIVYIQPRNKKYEVDPYALQQAVELVKANPILRLSPQYHKFLHLR